MTFSQKPLRKSFPYSPESGHKCTLEILTWHFCGCSQWPWFTAGLGMESLSWEVNLWAENEECTGEETEINYLFLFNIQS